MRPIALAQRRHLGIIGEISWGDRLWKEVTSSRSPFE